MTNEITERNINELIEYATNPREIGSDAVDKLAAMIHEFGFRVPIIAKSDGLIVDGHLRLLAAKKLGMTKVPCLSADDMSVSQIKAFRIAVNKAAEFAAWDDELLAVELQLLKNDDFDMDLIGFEDGDIDALITEFDAVDEGLTDEDAVPAIVEEPVTVLGDVWTLGNHRLMCGDSTSIDAVEKLMDGKKADMVFTDPPYGVDYEGIKNDSEEGLSELLSLSFQNYLHVSKSGASIYCFHADRTAHIFREQFNKFFHFSSMVIWVKNTLTLSQTDYQSKHESCMYGWMDNGTHSWYSDRKQTTIWSIDKETFNGHTTPKPVEVISRAILNSSKGGDIIVDLFGGSGSTIIGAEKNGRSAYLMELDLKYCDVIIKRWQEFTGKQAVHIESGKTYNELLNG